MVDAFILMAVIGAMCGLLLIADAIVSVIAFVVYKLDNGKHGFYKFTKRWHNK